MLLAEWFAWWGEMSPIQADEHLDAYLVHLLGDSGWTLDREPVLEAWRKVARRDSSSSSSSSSSSDSGPPTKDDVRQQFYRVRDWLRMYYGAGVSSN